MELLELNLEPLSDFPESGKKNTFKTAFDIFLKSVEIIMYVIMYIK